MKSQSLSMTVYCNSTGDNMETLTYLCEKHGSIAKKKGSKIVEKIIIDDQVCLVYGCTAIARYLADAIVKTAKK